MGSRAIVGEGRFLRLVRVDGWEWVERRKASAVVAVIAVTDADQLLLTEQRRRSVDARVIDLPAGLVGDDDAGEAIESAAVRELAEECGYRAQSVERLTAGPPSPGLASEVVTLVRARGLTRIGAGGGVDGEDIRVHAPDLAGIADWLRARERAGALIDLKVWAALAFVR